MLLDMAIVSVGAGLTAPAVHLIGPESSFGRGAVELPGAFGGMMAYWGSYWLLGALGFVFGRAAPLLTLGFGLVVWTSARREYLRRPPSLEAPLA